MTKFLKHIFIFLQLALVLGACSDDDLIKSEVPETNGELPVEFSFEWPGVTETRAFDDVTVKTQFADGDVIHIVGTFKTSALQEDGTYLDGSTARYGALRYDSSKREWNAISGNQLTWPSIATEGDFYAYYVSGVNGIITETTPITTKLSAVTLQSDPLHAPATGYIPYGRAVRLRFNHLCAHLTLNDMEPMVASNYFFTTDVLYKSMADKTEVPFNNAFQISLVKNEGVENDGTPNSRLTGAPALKFEFIQEVDPDYDMVYISGNVAESVTEDADGNEKIISKAGYFLEPALYEQFKVLYPAGPNSVYEYLSYNFNNIPETAGGVEFENTPPDLQAGTSYTMTITKSPGVTIVLPPSGDEWDEEEGALDVDERKFLQAVNNSEEYYNDDNVKILEKTPEGVLLLHNISFADFTYEDFTNLDFLPDVMESKVFDGGKHSIENLRSPLLRSNYGTVRNLWLKGVSYEAVSKEYSYGDQAATQDRSRHGALCMWNRQGAEISNVRVTDVDLTINVQYNNEEDDGGEVHNIGGVVGSNIGSINQLYLGGRFSVKVTSANNIQNADVLAGGIIGQIAGSGSLYDVSLLDDDFSLSLTNTCTGDIAKYELGGIVGRSSGFIDGIILSNLLIDSSGSQGAVSFIGGMAGNLDVTAGSSAWLRSCTVSGQIKAGVTTPYNVGSGDVQSTVNGQSYIGGLAGYENNVEVTGCRASVSVFSAATAQENVIYGTGGAFGRIMHSADIANLIAYGSQITSPSGSTESNYVGSFAGIVPADESWSDYENKNIIIHAFSNLREIGASMDN